jgi:pimeloyl-ACP methyl ester carboxylesterase
MLPIFIFDYDGHWRSRRAPMSNSADDLGGIRLDLHTAATAVAFLTALQLKIQSFEIKL